MNDHSQPRPDAPARRTTARGRRTRDALLDAALTLFAERGYAGTSVPDVAQRAGVAAGTLYRHFTGKEALVNGVYRRCKQALMAGLFAAVDLQVAPREQFRAFFGALADFAAAEPTAFAFLELHHHADYLDAESRDLEERSLHVVAAMVERGRAAGAFADHGTETVMALVWGAFVGLFKAARLGYLDLDPARLAEAEAICWRAIARSPTP